MTDDERFDYLQQMLRTGFDGVYARLDVLNGRTRENEKDIAVLQDRSDRAERQAERAEQMAASVQSRAGAFGGIVGGIISGVVIAAKALLSK